MFTMKNIFYLLGSVVLVLIIMALLGIVDVSYLFPQQQVTNEVVEVVNEPVQQPWYNTFYDPWRRDPPLWAGRRWWDRGDRHRDIVVIDGGGRKCRGGGCGPRRPRPRPRPGPPGPPGPAGPPGPPGPTPPVIPPTPPSIPDVPPPMPGPEIPIPPPGPPPSGPPPWPPPSIPDVPPPPPPAPEPVSPPPAESSTEGFTVRNRNRNRIRTSTTFPNQFTFNSQSNTLMGYEY